MINLIKNELFKIYKKKSTFVIVLITILFVIFNNTIYKKIDNIDINKSNIENTSITNDYVTYKEENKHRLSNYYNEHDLKLEYANLIVNDLENKYMIDNNVDLNSYSNLRYGFINILQDYSIFIIILTVAISGSIVSSEFDKGTIKLLLVRPYLRFKILLSKYITCMLVLLISILLIVLLETIIGGTFFGFNSLKIPKMIYNFNTNKVININILKYMFNLIITTLPKFIILSTISFSISTIINNSVVGVIVPIIAYFISDIINLIVTSYNINSLNYFITLNWNLSNYLYGGIGLYQNSNIYISILICVIYIIAILIPTFMIFSKKSIKNQ